VPLLAMVASMWALVIVVVVLAAMLVVEAITADRRRTAMVESR
jgi:hypothetical protein